MTLQSYTLSDLQNLRPELKRSNTPFSSHPSSAWTTPQTSRPNTAHGHEILETNELPPPWGPNSESWRSLHLALAQLIGTNRPLFAIDLLLVLLHRDPGFLPAIFALLCSYIYTWCSGGTTGARLVREDFLEEAIGIMIRLKETQEPPGNKKKNEKSRMSLLNSELIQLYGEESRESDFVFLLEKTYFWNAFRTGGCNARTLSLMSSIVLASRYAEFGTGLATFMVQRGEGIGRAHRLIDRVRDCSAYREAETVSLRILMLENLFESPHESIFKQRIGMRDLLEDVEEIEGVSRVVSVDLECFRSGEMLVVTGKVVVSRKTGKVDIPENLSKIDQIRERNKFKWTLAGNESVLQIRPLVLLPSEVEQVYSASIDYFTKSTGKPQQEIQMRPKWRTLSEFATQV